jgi:hypothetical protein
MKIIANSKLTILFMSIFPVLFILIEKYNIIITHCLLFINKLKYYPLILQLPNINYCICSFIIFNYKAA